MTGYANRVASERFGHARSSVSGAQKLAADALELLAEVDRADLPRAGGCLSARGNLAQ